MKLVVGLGNPGRKYEGTRHNIGFEVLRELADRHQADRPKRKFEAEVTEVNIAGNRTMLFAPQTYMNASGRSVQIAYRFYSMVSDDLLVVCDDINLPAGKIRLRQSGSAGGQKGLKNIVDHIHTEAIPRLRVGVGSPPQGANRADYVLGRFAKADTEVIQAAVIRSVDAVECWVNEGIEAAMNKFNAAE